MGQTVAGILAAAAIIGALVVIGKGAVWLAGVLRKLARLVDDLTGEPPRPGYPAGRPGVLDRLTSIEDRQMEGIAELAGLKERLAAVEAQLHLNNGTTLRDTGD